MFKLLTLLSVIASASAASITVTPCDAAGQVPKVRVTSVTTDKKITYKSTFTITATASDDVNIAGGSISYEADLGTVKLASGTEDLCTLSKDIIPCPIASFAKTFEYKVTLPALVVAGNYHVKATGTAQDGTHLFCLKADVSVALFEKSLRSDADACTYSTQTACDAVPECKWCICHALPSACHTLEQAKLLPPSVFDCGFSADYEAIFFPNMN